MNATHIRPATRTLAARVMLFTVLASAALAGPAPALLSQAHADPTPGNAVVMPFDVRESRARTSLTVTNVSGVSPGPNGNIVGVSTHWSFYGEAGDHLADVEVCAILNQTITVDPRRVSSLAVGQEPVGPTIDLSGHRGFVVVTAYATDEICSGASVLGYAPVDDALVGSFGISEKGLRQAYGTSGLILGLGADGRTKLPAPGIARMTAPVRVGNSRHRSFSRVILIPLAERRGSGSTADIEVGPARAPHALTADAVYYEGKYTIPYALPSLSSEGAVFTSVTSARDGWVPADMPLAQSGSIALEDIWVGEMPVANGRGTYLLAYHAMVVNQMPSITRFAEEHLD